MSKAKSFQESSFLKAHIHRYTYINSIKIIKSWKEIFYNIPIAIFDRPLYSFTLTKFKSLVYFRKEKVSKSLIKKFKNFEPPAWIFIDGLANFQSSTKIRNKSS